MEFSPKYIFLLPINNFVKFIILAILMEVNRSWLIWKTFYIFESLGFICKKIEHYGLNSMQWNTHFRQNFEVLFGIIPKYFIQMLVSIDTFLSKRRYVLGMLQLLKNGFVWKKKIEVNFVLGKSFLYY